MIKTNELMLGNWVECATGLNGEKRSIPMYVIAIDEDEALLNFDGNEADPLVIEDKDLLGIPITAELLEKCGYELGHDSIWKVGDTILHQTRHGFEVSLFGQFIEGIHFLHELQNAYRMLTKKEFEVKL